MSVGSRERWCHHLPEASVLVECGDAAAPHRVVWRRGKLVLENHDLSAERVLGALGGEPCICVELLEAWNVLRNVTVTPSYLTPEALAGGQAETVISTAALEEHPMFQRSMAHQKAVAAQLQNLPPEFRERHEEYLRRQRAELLVALLPDSFHARLTLATLARVARNREALPVGELVSFEIFVFRTARAAALESLQSWLRLDVNVYTDIDCRLGERGDQPFVKGSIEGSRVELVVSVSFDWITEVWARGLAVVDGCLVLSATGGPDTARCVAVRWQRRRAAQAEPVVVPAIARRLDGEWQLRWID